MILLDTHAFIWWHEGNPRLSARAKLVIEHEHQAGQVMASSLTCWEIALLVERRKLFLSEEVQVWIAAIETQRHVRFIPVDNQIAITSVQLPAGLSKDPADRIIVATAMLLNIPIVTVDRTIRAYPHVQTIW